MTNCCRIVIDANLLLSASPAPPFSDTGDIALLEWLSWGGVPVVVVAVGHAGQSGTPSPVSVAAFEKFSKCIDDPESSVKILQCKEGSEEVTLRDEPFSMSCSPASIYVLADPATRFGASLLAAAAALGQIPVPLPSSSSSWLPGAVLPALCSPSTARVGCALTRSRLRSLLRSGALSALAADGVCCLPLPLDGPFKCLADIDVILHKATDQLLPSPQPPPADASTDCSPSSSADPAAAPPRFAAAVALLAAAASAPGGGVPFLDCPTGLAAAADRLVAAALLDDLPAALRPSAGPAAESDAPADQAGGLGPVAGCRQAARESASAPRVRAPRWCRLPSLRPEDALPRLAAAGVRFPCIVKPAAACGVPGAHRMLVVLSEGGLSEARASASAGSRSPTGADSGADIGAGGGARGAGEAAGRAALPAPPLIAQEFVRHGGLLRKVYVVGGAVFMAARRSVPDPPPPAPPLPSARGPPPAAGPTGRASFAAFDALHGALPDWGPPPPDAADAAGGGAGDAAGAAGGLSGAVVEAAAAWLAAKTGWAVFGFDVVVETGSGDHVVVDLNYFPSLGGVAGAAAALRGALRGAAAPRAAARAAAGAGEGGSVLGGGPSRVINS